MLSWMGVAVISCVLILAALMALMDNYWEESE